MKSRSCIKRVKMSTHPFLRSTRTLIHSKPFAMFVLLAVCMVSNTFAQAAGSIDTLDNWASDLLALFSSGWVKALCCIALIVEAIGMIFAGQQGGGAAVFKKFAPWIIGTLVLLTASGITKYFLSDLSFEDYGAFLLPEQTEETVYLG